MALACGLIFCYFVDCLCSPLPSSSFLFYRQKRKRVWAISEDEEATIRSLYEQ